ncbi:MAG TPA: energy transducer TonB [Cellvibrionaceae bacterium]|nr:energy transducer TonB [Cellvibrionaceae bacterium]HMW73959.1 energy transducer TonB [Cellvibrionaceae bacterium]HMY40432.1 energy transducer TonB [Marinagarivorans sp.]HNG62075.1 energy transducer TonB [Cellvibrionaceae bacterium]
MYMLQTRIPLTDLAPRFSGLIFVIALHLGAAIALMAGLAPKQEQIKIADLNITSVVEPQVRVLPPPPRPVDYVPLPVEIPPPHEFFVATENSTAITPTLAKVESHPAAQMVVTTAAKTPARGLSAPAYPSDAKKLGEAGAVGLALYLNSAGRVQNAEIETSSGSPRLDQAAQQHALKSWQFIPCTEDGKAVACWHKIKFRFQLKDI